MKDVHIHFQYISSVQNHDLYFLLLKGCPNVEDAPSLVAPCADKIDLEHLSRDLPKYKPWLSNESRTGSRKAIQPAGRKKPSSTCMTVVTSCCQMLHNELYHCFADVRR